MGKWAISPGNNLAKIQKNKVNMADLFLKAYSSIRPSPKGRPLQECNGVVVWGHSLCPSVRRSDALRMVDD